MDDPDTEACDGWDSGQCRGTPHCPPRCPRFEDREGARGLVQPSREVDRQSLVEFYRGLPPEDRTMGLPPASEERLNEWLDRFTETGWSLVAVLDDRIVGHAGVTPSASATPHVVVFVDDAVQGRGIGAELVRHLVAHAADRDHEQLTLTVSDDNRPAIALYDTIGFDTVERVRRGREMRLPLCRPVAERVRRPPADRG